MAAKHKSSDDRNLDMAIEAIKCMYAQEKTERERVCVCSADIHWGFWNVSPTDKEESYST